jgi:hypothetical protein
MLSRLLGADNTSGHHVARCFPSAFFPLRLGACGKFQLRPASLNAFRFACGSTLPQT